MLDQATIAAAAARLEQAETSGQQTRAFTTEYAGMTIEDGYAIQRAWMEMKYAQGRVIKGRKIGLTSRTMQASLGIDEPDHGVLLDSMFFEDGADLPSSRFIVPRVEVELGFVLDRKLAGPGCTIFDVLDATAYVVPAMEILDARMHRVDPESGRMRTVIDTISDNAANAAIVVGGRPFKPMDTDLRWVAALCARNGIIEESGVAAAVLNHPRPRHRVARQSPGCARDRARTRSADPERILHPAGRCATRRRLSGRLRALRHRLLPFHLMHR